MHNKINERSQQILRSIVTRYIKDGQPVGSKTLAEDHSVSLSSATIRNIMAELEDAGYVRSPHTSAGRIPTTLGYRFFVNTLLEVKATAHLEISSETLAQLNASSSEQELMKSVSMLVSNITQLTGIVTVPRHNINILRHIEFLPLSQARILVILVLNEHEVRNLIIQTDREYGESELQQAANFLTAQYLGKDLLSIRQALLKEMRSDHENMDSMIHMVLDTAEKNLQQNKEDYVLAGESNLLSLAQEAGVDQLRGVFNAFSRKNDILHLLDGCLQNDGVQIFIGQESGYEEFGGCSLITMPYAVDKQVLGVLGVIGPTRMDYERAIKAVDVTAKILSATLKERL